MSLNVLKPKYRTQEVLDSIKECLDIGWTGMGNKTEIFEEKFKSYCSFNNAHFVNSATSGLHLALNVFKKIDNWDEQSEVITTPLTFISSNHAILYENLIPVFADVDESLCLDPLSVEKLINKNTKAILFVGLGGNIGEYFKIKEICDSYNLKLIFDAAHSMGTKVNRSYHGVAFSYSQIGWDADATVFSFQAVKNLPTADSGMVCFKDEKYDKFSRQISWMGIDKDTFSRTNIRKGSYKWDYDVPNLGFKYNGNSIMAAIGISQLKYIDEDNEYRRYIVDNYIGGLKDISNINIVYHNSQCKSSRHLFQIRVKNREDLLQFLYEYKIYPGVHYKSNKEYPMYKECKGNTPNAQKYQHEIISLPLHLNLKIKDINYITDLIKKYYD